MNSDVFEYQIVPSSAPGSAKKTSKVARVLVDNKDKVIGICSTGENLFGYALADIESKNFHSLVAASDQPQYFSKFLEGSDDGSKIELTFRHKDGYFITAEIRLAKDDEKTDTPVVPNAQAPKLVERSYKWINQLEKDGKIGAWYYDVLNERSQWSPMMFSILGAKRLDSLTNEQALYYFQDAQDKLRVNIRNCTEKRTPFTFKDRIKSTKNEALWLQVHGEPEIVDGEVIGIYGTLKDVTNERFSHYKQAYLESCLSSVFAKSKDLIAVVDNKGRCVSFNPAFDEEFSKLFGHPIKKGDSLPEILQHFPAEKKVYNRLVELANSRKQFSMTMPLSQSQARLPIYQVNLNQVTDGKGKMLGFTCIVTLDKKRSKTQQSANYFASHCPLTGLFNRLEFQHRLTRICQSSAKHDTNHALLHMQLLHLEKLEQIMGKGAAEECLKQASECIKSTLRQRDALARIAYSEFGLILEHCSPNKAVRVAHNIRHAISDLEFKLKGMTSSLDLKIGIVEISKDSDNAESMLGISANTCYAASIEKDDGVMLRKKVYTEQDVSHHEVRQAITLLRKALEKDEECLELNYQSMRPINKPVWGVHFEVLTRIHSPDAGVIEPDKFIPVATQFDVMQEFDKKVIEKTAKWLSENQDRGYRHNLCTINLSLDSIADGSIVQHIEQVVHAYQLEAEKFCFEIDEAYCASHMDSVKAFIRKLSVLDCKVMIDKVGSSKLDARYLCDLGADMIKIDGALVEELESKPENVIYLEGLLKITELKDIETVVSRIESIKALSKITQLGVDYGQGFALSRPQPIAKLYAA